MELVLVFPSSSWQSVSSINSQSLPLTFPLPAHLANSLSCFPGMDRPIPSPPFPFPFPEHWLGEVTVAFPSIPIPGYAMAAPAVMVENNLGFICLLGGGVSAVEHMETPVSPLSLLLPSLAHPTVPSAAEPLQSPKQNHWNNPSWVGFPWIS